MREFINATDPFYTKTTVFIIFLIFLFTFSDRVFGVCTTIGLASQTIELVHPRHKINIDNSSILT